MESKLKRKSGKRTNIDYPKLMMANNGAVVLFTEYEKGVCVHEGDSENFIGQYFDDGWFMGVFQDLDPAFKVVLSNGDQQ